MAEQYVGKVGEFKDGDRRIIFAGDNEIGVFRHEGQFYAYSNICLHQGGPACEGVVKGKVVERLGPDKSYLGQTYDHNDPHIVCPWHGWEYKLLTGECAPDPRLRLKKYDVVEREGGIYVVT